MTKPPYRPQSRMPWAPADLDPFYVDLLLHVLGGSVRVVKDSIVLHSGTRSEVVTGPAQVLIQLGLVGVRRSGVLDLTPAGYEEMFPTLAVVR